MGISRLGLASGKYISLFIFVLLSFWLYVFCFSFKLLFLFLHRSELHRYPQVRVRIGAWSGLSLASSEGMDRQICGRIHHQTGRST